MIVRAKDLNNYYMFQIGKKHIVPHRRISYPKIKSDSTNKDITEIEFQTGWQIFNDLKVELTKELDDWFVGRIKVNGQSVHLYINDSLVLHHESFLETPKGKIGFRCDGHETGYIKEVNVRLKI